MRMTFLACLSLVALSGCRKDSAPGDAGTRAPIDAGGVKAPGARDAIIGRWVVELDPETKRTAELAERAIAGDPLDGGAVLTFDEQAFVEALRDGGTEEAKELLAEIQTTEMVLTADSMTIKTGGTEDRVPYAVAEAGEGRVRIKIRPPELPEEEIVFRILGPDRITMGDTAEDPAAVTLRRAK